MTKKKKNKSSFSRKPRANSQISVGSQSTKRIFLEQANSVFEKITPFTHWMFIIIGAFFSVLMFEGKISVGFDDAQYIQSGSNYAEDFFGFWHSSNAPFYSIVLALPIAIFGINLTLLKVLSVVFFLLSIHFLQKAFEKRIPAIVIFFGMLFYTTNWATLSYASLTYQESLYIFIQAAFFYFFFNFIDNKEQLRLAWKPFQFRPFVPWLILGLYIFGLYFTRTVGIATLGACIVFFLWYKKYYSALYTLIATLIVIGFFALVKRILWGDVTQLGQASILFQKDAYDATKGNEDFMGFVIRFFQNTQIYFSQRLLDIVSLRASNAPKDILITVATLIPILTGFVWSVIKKQKYLVFVGLYCLALCTLTFITLQTSWGQLRLIMIYLPFFLFLSFYLLYELFKVFPFSKIQIVFFIPILLFFGINIQQTFEKIIINIPKVEANILRGDKYKGFTPDWENYLRLSEWCGKNLPENTLVACRKAPMSFIYANGKKFYLIAKGLSEISGEEKLETLKNAGVTHIILARLRVNENVRTDRFINTVHRYVQPFMNKLKKVHEIGVDEKATLYEILY